MRVDILQFNLMTILLIPVCLISIILTVYTWRRIKGPMRIDAFFVMLGISIFCTGSLFESIFTDLNIKILFNKIHYIGIVILPVYLLFYTLKYTNLDRWLTRKIKLLFFIIPAATILLVFTNGYHRIVWSTVEQGHNSIAGTFAIYVSGPWYWVNVSYSYLLGIISIGIFTLSLIRYRRFYSLQVRLLITAAIPPLLGGIIYSFDRSIVGGMDIIPLCFSITGFLVYLAIVKYQLLDITPIAREVVAENLQDGILMVNMENKIVDINDAVCEMLSMDDNVIGQPVKKALAGYNAILTLIDKGNGNKNTVKEIKPRGRDLFLEVRMDKLLDSRGRRIGMVIILRNITSRKIAKKKMKESQDILLDIIDFLPDATFAINKKRKVIAWNRAMERLSGVNRKDILGKGNYEYSRHFYGKRRPALADYILGGHKEKDKHYNTIKKEGDNLIAETDVKIKGKDVHLWLSASPLKDRDDRMIGAIESIRDMTNIKKVENELRYISFHDSLTGLYNRPFFEEELKRFDKPRMLPLSIIVADLNGLKLINDAFGHTMGDRLLRKASAIIKDSCRSEDVIARWGGDEFSILLPSTDSNETEEIIDRIQSACKKTKFKIPISISLGYSIKEKPNIRIDNIIKKAEDSMYSNKLISSKMVKNEIVGSLIHTFYSKSIETEASSEKVAELSTTMGEKLDLPEKEMEELIMHARFHDIGNVAIRRKILAKKGKLNDNEWKEIKKHTMIGYRIANSSTLIYPIAEYILCQHEWWDGSGYPRKLEGLEIPLISRIVSITDSYEAMLSKRPYRKAYTKKEAVCELEKYAGIQFDPDLVGEFVEMIGEPA